MRPGLADFRPTIIQRIRHLNTSTTGALWRQSLREFTWEISSLLRTSPTMTFEESAKRLVSELFACIAGSRTAPRFLGLYITAEHVEACRSSFPGSHGVSDFGVRLVTLFAVASLVHENPSLDLSNPHEVLNAVYCWVNGTIWNPNHTIEKSRIENQLEYCVHFAKSNLLHQERRAYNEYASHGYLINTWTSSLPMDKLISLFQAVRRYDVAGGGARHGQHLLLIELESKRVLEVLTDIDINLSMSEREECLLDFDFAQLERLVTVALGFPLNFRDQRGYNEWDFVSKILESRKQIIHCARITIEQRQNFLSHINPLQKTLLIDVLSNVTVEQQRAFLGSITVEQLRAFWRGFPAEARDKKLELWGMLSLEQKLDLFQNSMDDATRRAVLLQMPVMDMQAFRHILWQEELPLQVQRPSPQEAMARKLSEFLAQLNMAPLAEGLEDSDIMHLINHYQARMPQGPHDYMDQVNEGTESIDIRSEPMQILTDMKVEITNPDLQSYLEAEGRLPVGQTSANILYQGLMRILNENDQDLYEEDTDFRILPGVQIINPALRVYLESEGRLPLGQTIQDLSYFELIQILGPNELDLYTEGLDFRILQEVKMFIPNPEFEVSVLSEDTRQEISNLEDEIKAAVAGLSTYEKAKIETDHSDFLEATMRAGQFRMYLTVNSNVYDRSVLVDLLVALKTQNKADFISVCVKIHTILGNLEETKSGFITTFIHLFVTHYFPSAGCKGKYYHYLLRCGQVH